MLLKYVAQELPCVVDKAKSSMCLFKTESTDVQLRLRKQFDDAVLPDAVSSI